MSAAFALAPVKPTPATVAGPVTQARVIRAEWTKPPALRSQVGGDAVAVQGGVVGARQRGADPVSWPVRAHGQDRQVMVSEPGRVADLQRMVEGPEPVDPGTGHRGEPLVVALGRGRRFLAGGQPQRAGRHRAAARRRVAAAPASGSVSSFGTVELTTSAMCETR
jgi:hypothetical protein